jgi:thiamine-phosphate pyrophosphorylase
VIASWRILLVTDGYDATTTPARVEAAIAELPTGAAAVMLRAKALAGRALYAAAERLRAIVPILIVNDRADVAMAVGADGVHLPAQGLPVADARRLCEAWAGTHGGLRLAVGVSTHSLAAALAGADGGADYVVFGPVFATADKGPPVGLAALREVVEAVPVPVFAIGGVDAGRAASCVAAGARVACIGAVLGRDDAGAGARALAAAIG